MSALTDSPSGQTVCNPLYYKLCPELRGASPRDDHAPAPTRLPRPQEAAWFKHQRLGVDLRHP